MWMAGEVSIQIYGEDFWPWLFKVMEISDDDVDADPIVDVVFQGEHEQLSGILVKTKGGDEKELNSPEEFWTFFSELLPKFINRHEWIASKPKWSKDNDCVCITLAFDTESHPVSWAVKPTFLR
jgi:hypothetical protein